MRGYQVFSASSAFFEVSKWVVVFAIIVIAIGFLVGLPLAVSGESMTPNFQSHEIVVVDRLTNILNQPINRGDVVAARFPADPDHTKLIKRVLGLPGESVRAQDGRIFINNIELHETYDPIIAPAPYTEISELKLKSDEYFLVGDNRPGSSDSRLWGPVVRQDIIGRVRFVLLPPSHLRFVINPFYPST